MCFIDEKYIEDYLLDFRQRWLKHSLDLKDADYFEIYFEWVSMTMLNEIQIIEQIIHISKLDSETKNKMNYLTRQILYVLFSDLQKSLILSIKKKPNFWDKYFGRIKKVGLSKNLGCIEFGKVNNNE